jgi:hypothetical protein
MIGQVRTNCSYVTRKQFGTYDVDICVGTLCLNSDSTFFYYSGCELNSSNSFGKYAVLNDRLILSYKNFDNSSFVCINKKPQDSTSSTSKLKFVDKLGAPFRDLIIAAFVDLKKNKFETLYTDSLGWVIINLNKFSEITFPYINSLTGLKSSIKTRDLSYGSVIKLDINLFANKVTGSPIKKSNGATLQIISSEEIWDGENIRMKVKKK